MPTSPSKIEVKFAVAENDTETAIAGLGLTGPPDEEYTVHFFDREPPSLGSPAVGGFILRVRQMASGKGPDDSTFKVRGSGASAAFASFGANGAGKRKFEGDKNVDAPEKDSFSITLEPPLVDISAILGGKPPLAILFDRDAETIMAKAGVTWAGLLAYGPIHARKWEDLEVDGLKGKVTVELWKAGIFELLEISDKKSRDEAPAFESALRQHMRETVGVSQMPGSKTEFALKHLKPFAISVAG